MLETIREYALERLRDEGGLTTTRSRRHAEFFLALAESANLTADDLDAQPRHELVRPDADNLRAAIDRAVALVDVELACSIAVALEQFWVTTSPHEGARRLAELLETGAELPKRLRARALRVRGGTNYIAGNFEDASRWHAEALALFRELEDEPAISHMFFRLAVEAWRAGDPERRARSLPREPEPPPQRDG